MNILERILIKTTRPLRDQLEVEYDNEELDVIIEDLLVLINRLIDKSIKELKNREEELREEITRKERNIRRIEGRLTRIHE